MFNVSKYKKWIPGIKLYLTDRSLKYNNPSQISRSVHIMRKDYRCVNRLRREIREYKKWF